MTKLPSQLHRYGLIRPLSPVTLGKKPSFKKKTLFTPVGFSFSKPSVNIPPA